MSITTRRSSESSSSLSSHSMINGPEINSIDPIYEEWKRIQKIKRPRKKLYNLFETTDSLFNYGDDLNDISSSRNSSNFINDAKSVKKHRFEVINPSQFEDKPNILIINDLSLSKKFMDEDVAIENDVNNDYNNNNGYSMMSKKDETKYDGYSMGEDEEYEEMMNDGRERGMESNGYGRSSNQGVFAQRNRLQRNGIGRSKFQRPSLYLMDEYTRRSLAERKVRSLWNVIFDWIESTWIFNTLFYYAKRFRGDFREKKLQGQFRNRYRNQYSYRTSSPQRNWNYGRYGHDSINEYGAYGNNSYYDDSHYGGYGSGGYGGGGYGGGGINRYYNTPLSRAENLIRYIVDKWIQIRDFQVSDTINDDQIRMQDRQIASDIAARINRYVMGRRQYPSSSRWRIQQQEQEMITSSTGQHIKNRSWTSRFWTFTYSLFKYLYSIFPSNAALFR